MRLVVLLFLFMVNALYSSAQEYTVVASEIGTTVLSKSELKTVFKPKNNFWPNNRPVLLVLPGNQSALKDRISGDIYGTSYVAMQKYWLSLVFQGRFNAPISLNTDEEVIAYIRKNPGAIGFVKDPSIVPPAFIIQIKD